MNLRVLTSNNFGTQYYCGVNAGASHSQPTVAPRARGRRKYPVTYPAPVVPQLVLPQDQRLGSWGVRWKIELRLLALQVH